VRCDCRILCRTNDLDDVVAKDDQEIGELLGLLSVEVWITPKRQQGSLAKIGEDPFRGAHPPRFLVPHAFADDWFLRMRFRGHPVARY
jgi:hypothetical protein